MKNKKPFTNLAKRSLAMFVALATSVSLLQVTAFGVEEVVENEDGSTTVIDITEQVWNEDNASGSSTTKDSVTTDPNGNVLEESSSITGTETTKTENPSSTSTENVTGGGGASITVIPGQDNSTEVDADAIFESIKQDTSGKEWTKNEDGSFTKKEDVKDGTCVTTVKDSTDENGNKVYTTETVTTTEVTEPAVFDVPEAGTTTNPDGSRTTITVVTDENGVVTGYTELTEVLNAAGVVTSSVTKTVAQSGKTTTTTTTRNVKTQVVAPDTKGEIKVTVGEVTAGDKQGALHTNGLKVTDTPTADNDLLSPEKVESNVTLDDLEDDDLVFVAGIGLTSKYNLTIMYTQNKNGGWMKYSKGWPVQQYIVKDKDGNEHPVYCADMSVMTEDAVKYFMNNTEDADYYTNPNNNQKDPTGGDHLRDIALNGYWGTEEGTGSLSALVEKLLAAKDAGDPALENLSKEQIESLTAGQALTATQAAIWKYGNSLSLNPSVLQTGTLTQAVTPDSKLEYDPAAGVITRITTTYNKETGETTITTEEIKLNLPAGAEITVKRNPETQEIESISYPKYSPAYVKLLPDGWLNNPNHSLVGGTGHKKDDPDVQLIEAVYKYLTALEEEDTTTDLIQPSDIVEAVTTVKEAIGKNEENHDVYNTDMSFVLTVEPSRLNGDLLVNVYDSETGELITTRRIAGDGSNDDASIKNAKVEQGEKGIIYTIEDLQLANGQTVRINLVGSQEVKKGAYLVTAQTGHENHQTFVGVEEGYREVDLNFTLKLDATPGVVNTTESSSVEEVRTWEETTDVQYNYYRLDLPNIPTDPGPDDPTPTPTPDPEDPTIEIPDEPTPLSEQPSEDDLIDIFDEDVPLANAAGTGNYDAVWYLVAILAVAGILSLGAAERKATR